MYLYSATNNTITATNNTITAINLKSTTDSIAPFSFTLNLNVTLSQKVGTYQLSVTSLSSGESVDTGKVAITTQ